MKGGGVIWAEKSVFYCKKGGSFWTEKSVFYHKKRGHFELKSQSFCCKKGGHFQTGEQGWVPFFPVSEVAGKQTCLAVSLPKHTYVSPCSTPTVPCSTPHCNTRLTFGENLEQKYSKSPFYVNIYILYKYLYRLLIILIPVYRDPIIQTINLL